MKAIRSVLIIVVLIVCLVVIHEWCSETGEDSSQAADDLMLARPIQWKGSASTLNLFAGEATADKSRRIYVSIKTSGKFHTSRLSLQLVTWLQTVDPSQVHIITDTNDKVTNIIRSKGLNVIVAKCGSGHLSLCCKSGCEFDQYYRAKVNGEDFGWYCHFDDDEYVNTAELPRALFHHCQNPTEEKCYLGRWPGWPAKGNGIGARRQFSQYYPERKSDYFNFVSGAVYCLSSALMVEVENYLRGENFVHICERIHPADDKAVGSVVEGILGYNLTHVPAMMNEIVNSKVNRTELSDVVALKKLVTVGCNQRQKLRVNIPNSLFDETEDPMGFLSYHCLLNPKAEICIKSESWKCCDYFSFLISSSWYIN